ncbi:hypothetical protein CAQU_10045 [Corynebacterium aquilae DSM 44791]|uniref:IrrE N-terminal-like domain-containing protein n=1 Tax=Corynebacterium aquilae DSM 44791 TaxID=1431546 RepID=A0A1L7CHL2_9CORY|nr:hypothetical protein CAQU_10045 [Corynebacterium aquilae DSM 44791]
MAYSAGIRIIWHNGHARGYYDNERRVISLRNGMSDREARSTLAHELGHALHGDTPTPDPVLHARQERRANEFAARLLIDPAELAVAEAAYGADTFTLARELDVSPHLIDTFRATVRTR